MNIALWIVQVLLAASFLASGGIKLFAYQKYKAMSEKNGSSGLSHGLVTFIGLSEVAGAVGIVLPMAVNVAPWLSPPPQPVSRLSCCSQFSTMSAVTSRQPRQEYCFCSV